MVLFNIYKKFFIRCKILVLQVPEKSIWIAKFVS